MKLYKAIVWESGPQKPGQRVELLADSLDEARKQLEEKFPKGRVFTLYNEEDSKRPR